MNDALRTTLILVLTVPVLAAEDSTCETVARISFPYHNSLIRASIPLFGKACAKNFKSYRIEFGQTKDPVEWTLIKQSDRAEPNDPWQDGAVKWNKDWGATDGNLGTWQTGLTEYPYGQRWEHNLLGPYTLRLTVTDKQGREAQHSVHVIVGRVVRNDLGGAVESPDGIARLEAGKDSITTAFVLVSLLPSSEPKPPKGLIPIGAAYEFQPPGLEFITPARLRFKCSPEELDAAGAISSACPTTSSKARRWKTLGRSRIRRGGRRTDPNGFLMELSETGDATGEYIGESMARGRRYILLQMLPEKDGKSA